MCKKKLFRHYATASVCNAWVVENSAIRAVLKKTASHPQKKHRLSGAFFVDYTS